MTRTSRDHNSGAGQACPSRPAFAWPPPAAQWAGLRAETAGLARPGGSFAGQPIRHPPKPASSCAPRGARRDGPPAAGGHRGAVHQLAAAHQALGTATADGGPAGLACRGSGESAVRKRLAPRMGRFSARGRLAADQRAAGGRPGGNGKAGSAWRPSVAPGGDRGGLRRRAGLTLLPAVAGLRCQTSTPDHAKAGAGVRPYCSSQADAPTTNRVRISPI
jgi:hypothetical protein